MAKNHRLQLLVPKNKNARPEEFVEIGLAKLPRDWWYNDGFIRWQIDGVMLLDGSFSIYPNCQIDAVLSIAVLMGERGTGHVNIEGSRLWLYTTPAGNGHATIACHSGGKTGRLPSDAVSVDTDVGNAIEAVASAVRTWMESAPRVPSPRPSSSKSPSTLDELATQLLARADQLLASKSRLRS